MLRHGAYNSNEVQQIAKSEADKEKALSSKGKLQSAVTNGIELLHLAFTNSAR